MSSGAVEAEAAPATHWHALTADAALEQLSSSSSKGLTSDEALKRLDVYGPNALTPPPKPTFLRRLWNQVNT
jgi:magnesium-transporting ATPase (P-type)